MKNVNCEINEQKNNENTNEENINKIKEINEDFDKNESNEIKIKSKSSFDLNEKKTEKTKNVIFDDLCNLNTINTYSYDSLNFDTTDLNGFKDKSDINESYETFIKNNCLENFNLKEENASMDLKKDEKNNKFKGNDINKNEKGNDGMNINNKTIKEKKKKKKNEKNVEKKIEDLNFVYKPKKVTKQKKNKKYVTLENSISLNDFSIKDYDESNDLYFHKINNSFDKNFSDYKLLQIDERNEKNLNEHTINNNLKKNFNLDTIKKANALNMNFHLSKKKDEQNSTQINTNSILACEKKKEKEDSRLFYSCNCNRLNNINDLMDNDLLNNGIFYNIQDGNCNKNISTDKKKDNLVNVNNFSYNKKMINLKEILNNIYNDNIHNDNAHIEKKNIEFVTDKNKIDNLICYNHNNPLFNDVIEEIVSKKNDYNFNKEYLRIKNKENDFMKNYEFGKEKEHILIEEKKNIEKMYNSNLYNKNKELTNEINKMNLKHYEQKDKEINKYMKQSKYNKMNKYKDKTKDDIYCECFNITEKNIYNKKINDCNLEKLKYSKLFNIKNDILKSKDNKNYIYISPNCNRKDNETSNINNNYNIINLKERRNNMKDIFNKNTSFKNNLYLKHIYNNINYMNNCYPLIEYEKNIKNKNIHNEKNNIGINEICLYENNSNNLNFFKNKTKENNKENKNKFGNMQYTNSEVLNHTKLSIESNKYYEDHKNNYVNEKKCIQDLDINTIDNIEENENQYINNMYYYKKKNNIDKRYYIDVDDIKKNEIKNDHNIENYINDQKFMNIIHKNQENKIYLKNKNNFNINNLNNKCMNPVQNINYLYDDPNISNVKKIVSEKKVSLNQCNQIIKDSILTIKWNINKISYLCISDYNFVVSPEYNTNTLLGEFFILLNLNNINDNFNKISIGILFSYTGFCDIIFSVSCGIYKKKNIVYNLSFLPWFGFENWGLLKNCVKDDKISITIQVHEIKKNKSGSFLLYNYNPYLKTIQENKNDTYENKKNGFNEKEVLNEKNNILDEKDVFNNMEDFMKKINKDIDDNSFESLCIEENKINNNIKKKNRKQGNINEENGKNSNLNKFNSNIIYKKTNSNISDFNKTNSNISCFNKTNSNVSDFNKTNSNISYFNESNSNLLFKKTNSNVSGIKLSNSNMSDFNKSNSSIIFKKSKSNITYKKTNSNISDLKISNSNVSDLNKSMSNVSISNISNSNEKKMNFNNSNFITELKKNMNPLNNSDEINPNYSTYKSTKDNVNKNKYKYNKN